MSLGMIPRPDLDGCRLQKPGEPDVWLVFHGKRHRISSPSTYFSLFATVDGLSNVDCIDEIDLGPDLQEGTFLARPDGSLAVYLVSRTASDDFGRHHIPNWETMCEFRFDEAKVRVVSPALLKEFPGRGDILSPLGRCTRDDPSIAKDHDNQN